MNRFWEQRSLYETWQAPPLQNHKFITVFKWHYHLTQSWGSLIYGLAIISFRHVIVFLSKPQAHRRWWGRRRSRNVRFSHPWPSDSPRRPYWIEKSYKLQILYPKCILLSAANVLPTHKKFVALILRWIHSEKKKFSEIKYLHQYYNKNVNKLRKLGYSRFAKRNVQQWIQIS